MDQRRLLLLIVTLLMVGTAACESDDDPAAVSEPTSTLTSTSASEATDAPETETRTGPIQLYDVSSLVEAARPGVVSVTQSQLRLDYFGQPMEVPAGAGTGVVISADGEILTNAHVVAGADTVIVTTWEGEGLDAEVVAASPRRDLALLQVESDVQLDPLELASSDAMEVGEPVVAMGNALGLDAADLTVSVGIVSAKDRALETPQGLLSGLIQTDAAINPGNSGGPLLNADGQVVGINTAIARGAQNVGFAIGVDTAVEVLDRLRTGLPEPFLGVAVVDNSEAVAEQIGIDVGSGAVVVGVEPGSPAAEADIRRFDVITSIDGTEVATADDVVEATLSLDPGTETTVDIVRDGDSITVDLTVGALPS